MRTCGMFRKGWRKEREEITQNNSISISKSYKMFSIIITSKNISPYKTEEAVSSVN